MAAGGVSSPELQQGAGTTDQAGEKAIEERMRSSAVVREMLAVHMTDVPQHSIFHEGKRDPSGGHTFLNEKEMKQDQNFNIVDETYDRNQNWNELSRRGKEMLDGTEGISTLDDNLEHQRAKCRLKDLSQTMRSEGIGLSSEEEVRSPPEGAEVGNVEEEEDAVEDTIRVCEDWAGSPMEDNGYASSSLSIDSPDSIIGNTWDLTTATPAEPTNSTEQLEPVDPDADTDSDADAYFPTLSETLQNLQDKELLKRQEKEKHQVHLTMYRRLALLRWIRGLQQKVVDQQNRLQESFDTILDNRKELLRCIQHGIGCSKESAAEAV